MHHMLAQASWQVKVAHIPLSKAAESMGLAPFNARKRLQRLEQATGEPILLWTGTRWLVNPVALERATTDRREDLGDLERRIGRLELAIRKLAKKA